MKSKELLDDFTKYCETNPDQRFWQALANWTQHTIYAKFDRDIEDTFYWENKTS